MKRWIAAALLSFACLTGTGCCFLADAVISAIDRHDCRHHAKCHRHNRCSKCCGCAPRPPCPPPTAR